MKKIHYIILAAILVVAGLVILLIHNPLMFFVGVGGVVGGLVIGNNWKGIVQWWNRNKP